jgi:hypothetical protein
MRHFFRHTLFKSVNYNTCNFSLKKLPILHKVKYSRFVSLKPLLFLYIIFFDKSIFEKTFTIKENSSNIQSVSAKTFELNISVICQRIFMKFKMQIHILDREGSISNNKITSS